MNTYNVKLACSNCGYRFVARIEKGESVADYCALHKCPQCENTNTLHKVAEK